MKAIVQHMPEPIVVIPINTNTLEQARHPQGKSNGTCELLEGDRLAALTYSNLQAPSVMHRRPQNGAAATSVARRPLLGLAPAKVPASAFKGAPNPPLPT